MFARAAYADRLEAGRALAERLKELELSTPLVLGLPRGGVVVAREVADVLGARLDVLTVRKLGAPGHEELALGAVGSGGARVLDSDLVASFGLDEDAVESLVSRATAELDRRERLYRGDEPAPDLAGQQVILVDDGVATGSTARVACQVARQAGAAHVVFAAPVAPAEAPQELAVDADAVVIPTTPRHFGWVGRWFADFAEVTDEQVKQALTR